MHRVTEGQVSLGPKFWNPMLQVPEVLGLTIIGARGSWTFDNLLSPDPWRLYLESKEENMLLCQYDREDCWKRNLKRALFSKRSLKVWHKGFSCWMTVTKLSKLACWTQLPLISENQILLNLEILTLLLDWSPTLHLQLNRSEITELEVIMNLKETDGHWTGRWYYRS